MMIGQSIQQDLALVGVHVEPSSRWHGRRSSKRFVNPIRAAGRPGWEADFSDPQNFLEVLLSRKQWGGNNDTFYYNPEVDKLLAEAALISDMKKRYAIYNQAQLIIIADAPWVFLPAPVQYVMRLIVDCVAFLHIADRAAWSSNFSTSGLL